MSNKIKLVIIADPLDNQYAGVYRFTHAFLEELHKDPGDFEVILIRQKSGNRFSKFQEKVIPNLSWIPYYHAFRVFFLFPWAIRKTKADMVLELAHFGPFNLPSRIIRCTFIHDLTPLIHPEHHIFFGWFLQKIFLPGIIRRASLVLCNSEYTRRDIEKEYPQSKGKVKSIHLGVSDEFRYIENREVLQKYHIQQSYILFVGTIEPRKNLIQLLTAFEQLKTAGKKLDLVLVGKRGWKNENFYKAVEKSPFRPDIKLCGYVDKKDLPGLYSHCTLFVYPSLYEGFGLPVVEAMACGAPCLISHSSSLVEIGEGAAEYFYLEKENDLFAKLDSLLLNEKKRAEMQQLSLTKSKEFSWYTFVKEFTNAMHKLYYEKVKA